MEVKEKKVLRILGRKAPILITTVVVFSFETFICYVKFMYYCSRHLTEKKFEVCEA